MLIVRISAVRRSVGHISAFPTVNSFAPMGTIVIGNREITTVTFWRERALGYAQVYPHMFSLNLLYTRQDPRSLSDLAFGILGKQN